MQRSERRLRVIFSSCGYDSFRANSDLRSQCHGEFVPKSGPTLCSLPDEPRLQIEPFNDVDNRLIRGWELEGLVVVLKHIVPHVALETPLTYGHNAP